MSGSYDLRNKVVLVTGASQGLGRQFAEILSANGARVALAAVSYTHLPLPTNREV